MSNEMNDAQKLVDGLSGFTPGPWTWDETKNGSYSGIDEVFWVEEYAGAAWLEFAQGCDDPEANTALIAAAPELHAAVVALLADNAKLRAALDEIAQERDYPMGIGIDPRPSRCAEIARAALEEPK